MKSLSAREPQSIQPGQIMGSSLASSVPLLRSESYYLQSMNVLSSVFFHANYLAPVMFFPA